MPYARSPPEGTTSKVNSVPGNPKINVITFQTMLPFACARMPVKLRLAKIQMAETPPCVPAVEAEVSWEAAIVANRNSTTLSRARQFTKRFVGLMERKRKRVCMS